MMFYYVTYLLFWKKSIYELALKSNLVSFTLFQFICVVYFHAESINGKTFAV